MQGQQTQAYFHYLQHKVDAARKQRREGKHYSNEEVEVEAAARRADLLFNAGLLKETPND